jgi:hypothetical protein
MWSFFGIFTLIASTIWGVRVPLAAAWRGDREYIGKEDRTDVVKRGHSQFV